jgi:protein-S-isoprenylcysteine O-methyltransferase Ste14
MRTLLQRTIRPSTTQSTAALWAKSLLNAALFFSIFMVALPWLAQRLLPLALPVPERLGGWLAATLGIVGVTVWIACLDAFSRRGRGTPLPVDAPRRLVTSGPFAVMRNPIMAAELLVIWAEALYCASLGITLYAIAMSVAAQWMVLRIEEPELRERFGDRYEDYCRSVPRWFPRLRPRTDIDR